MEAVLNIVAPFALVVMMLGVGLRLGRWGMALVRQSPVRGMTERFEGGEAPMSVVEALREVLIGPIRTFYRKANPTWNRGYVLYHMAIVTEVIGYSLAGLILMGRIVMGHAIPDVSTHAAASANYSPANLLAIVFGNGESLQAEFLFGGFAPVFISVTWVAVI